MAFKKIQTGGGNAVSLGKKKGEVKSVTGFLLGVVATQKSYKVRGRKKPEIRTSYRYNLAGEKGGSFSMWGNGSLNYALLDEKGKLSPDFKDKLCRFTFKGMLKAKPGQNPGREIEFEVDEAAKLPKDAGRIKF